MIASLPMYQRPELSDAHNRYWQLIRHELTKAGLTSPPALSQDAEEFATWLDPSLVLSQTCGMPYRNGLHGRVQLVGTPDFGVDGCAPGFYRSALVVRLNDTRRRVEDFASATFAYNQDHSQSGYAAPYDHVTKLGFWFEKRLGSGQHLASARAVVKGAADLAALDAVTWRLIEQHEPFARELRVIDWTEPTPGLPYITALDADASAIFGAVGRAIGQLIDADREALGLRGLVRISAEDYLSVPNPPVAITDQL